MQITTELIKELRDTTGISVMQCKRALEEAGGDKEKAIAILKKTSSDIASKKASREVKAGSVMVKEKGERFVLVSLLCETDFVAKNEDFINLLSKLTDLTLKEGIDKMKEQSKEMINAIIQKTGENIQLGEVEEISGKIIGSYIHNGKSAVLVSLEGGNMELAKDIAMHITAMKPEYITVNDIGENIKKTMTEIFEKEIDNIDKPEEIKKKMLEGKMNTYFKEKTLLDQLFIKDDNKTVGKLLEEAKARILEVKRCLI